MLILSPIFKATMPCNFRLLILEEKVNYAKVSGSGLNEYLDKYDVLVCCLRKSRNKAKRLAIFELSTVLRKVGGIFVFNGLFVAGQNQMAVVDMSGKSKTGGIVE